MLRRIESASPVPASDSIAAAAFYVGLTSGVAGAFVVARSVVEKRPGRSAGLALLVLGAAVATVALVIYVRGPRTLLPF